MMHATNSQADFLNLPAIPEIARLIEDNLAYDWILRVEHSASDVIKPMHRQWKQWGDSLFAITDPSPVIDSIVACRASHPDHNIRLHAEKVRPSSRLYYWVYTPEQHAQDTPMIEHDSVDTPARANQLLPSLRNTGMAVRARVWRVVTIIGVLLASLLMLEEVMA
jgi:ribulose bisphosphate carboxylase small subunit